MEARRTLVTAALISILASALQAQPLPPPPGGNLPPPTDGTEFPECTDPMDCIDPGDNTDGEESDDPLAGLLDAIDALHDFTQENCNSKKDMVKFQALLKELKDVVGKLRKIPGLEDNNDDISSLNDELRSVKSDLKELCVDEEDSVDEEEGL